MKPPLISGIVPVFNGEQYLAEALDSILTQTYRPLEIIVADDGSTDGTALLLPAMVIGCDIYFSRTRGLPPRVTWESRRRKGIL